MLSDKIKTCAKLIDADRNEFLIEMGVEEIVLGREKNQDPKTYFQIGKTNAISKKHVRIFWDDD